MSYYRLSTFALLTTSAMLCLAERNTDLKPLHTRAGKQIVDETFAAPALGKVWAANKGDWQVRDGVLVGKEKASDEHAAVLTLGQPNRDSILRISFCLDGAKGFNVSWNHAKGHLFRVGIAEDGLTLNKDKDKKDPASKVVALGKAAGKFEAGKWHTLLIEVQGGKVFVQADNGVKLQGSHPELDVEKTGYRFVTRGESVRIADVKVWQIEKPLAAAR